MMRTKVSELVAIRRRKWKAMHEGKQNKLREETPPATRPARIAAHNVVHNFSSYTLLDEDHRLLSFLLDHYILGKDVGKRTQVEFERFYQDI